MKKTKVAVSVLIHEIHPLAKITQDHMMYSIGKAFGEDVEFLYLTPWRNPVDTGRNFAVEQAMYHECDYLVFYDDDMIPPPNLVTYLYERIVEFKDKIHVLMAECSIRGYPFNTMCFRYIDDKNIHMKKFKYTQEDIDENGMVKVDAVGTPCTILDMEVFKLIPKPWFLTGQFHTEDVYFCMKADKYVGGIGLYIDTTIECGHLFDTVVINKETKAIMLKYWEDTPGEKDGLWRIFPTAAKPEIMKSEEEPAENPFKQDEEMEDGTASD